MKGFEADPESEKTEKIAVRPESESHQSEISRRELFDIFREYGLKKFIKAIDIGEAYVEALALNPGLVNDLICNQAADIARSTKIKRQQESQAFTKALKEIETLTEPENKKLATIKLLMENEDVLAKIKSINDQLEKLELTFFMKVAQSPDPVLKSLEDEI